MRTAAHVAHTFHLDPLELLREKDQLAWAVRVAAHDLIVTEQNEQAEKAKANRGGRVAGHRGR